MHFNNEILYRPKRGFVIPLSRWFRGQLSEYVRDLYREGA